jgi:hypothetical protein
MQQKVIAKTSYLLLRYNFICDKQLKTIQQNL